MKIHITGAMGFIGSHLTKALIRQNVNFESIQRTAGNKPLFHSGKCDVVIHLAGIAHVSQRETASSRTAFMKANCEYGLDVAREAYLRGMKRFVFISSASVYGLRSSRSPITEGCHSTPTEIYGLSKLKGELKLRELSDDLGFDLVIIRPALVYGHDAPGNIERILRFLSQNKTIFFSSGKNKRSFLYIENLIEFLIEVATNSKVTNEVFNLADEPPISTLTLYQNLGIGMNRRLAFPQIPRVLWRLFLNAIGQHKLYQQLFEDLILDCSKAHKVLQWRQPYDTELALKKVGENYVSERDET